MQELRKHGEKFSEDFVTAEMRTLRLLNTSHKLSFLFIQLNAHWFILD